MHCYYFTDDSVECGILFDTINNPTTHEYDKKCIEKINGLNVYYYPDKEEFVFSCLSKDGGIQISTYDKNLTNNPNTINVFSDCNNIYGYSLLYLSDISDYVLLPNQNRRIQQV